MRSTIALEAKQKGRESNNPFFISGLSTTYNIYFSKRFLQLVFVVNPWVYKMVYKQSHS